MTTQQPPSVNLENPTAPKVIEKIVIQSDNFLQWLFLGLWLLTLLAWFISAKRSTRSVKTTKVSDPKVNNAYLALLAACKKNNGELALANLLPWAQSQSSNSELLTTLDSIHSHFKDTALSNAIIELQKSYYGKNPSQWSGNNLIDAIQNVNKQNNVKLVNTELSLNP